MFVDQQNQSSMPEQKFTLPPPSAILNAKNSSVIPMSRHDSPDSGIGTGKGKHLMHDYTITRSMITYCICICLLIFCCLQELLFNTDPRSSPFVSQNSPQHSPVAILPQGLQSPPPQHSPEYSQQSSPMTGDQLSPLQSEPSPILTNCSIGEYPYIVQFIVHVTVVAQYL